LAVLSDTHADFSSSSMVEENPARFNSGCPGENLITICRKQRPGVEKIHRFRHRYEAIDQN
jgi:hypothetical protein